MESTHRCGSEHDSPFLTISCCCKSHLRDNTKQTENTKQTRKNCLTLTKKLFSFQPGKSSGKETSLKVHTH